VTAVAQNDHDAGVEDRTIDHECNGVTEHPWRTNGGGNADGDGERNSAFIDLPVELGLKLDMLGPVVHIGHDLSCEGTSLSYLITQKLLTTESPSWH